MRVFHKEYFYLLFLLFLLLLSAPANSEQTKYIISNDYLAGFIKGKNNIGLEDATIVVTDERNKILSLRSGQNGWFETYSPLGKITKSDEINFFVMKRGYKPLKVKVIRQHKAIEKNNQATKKSMNILNIHLEPIPNYYIDNESHDYLSDVLYGYVHDESDDPVKGAIITITDNADKESLPISSAVTRDSGFFSLYYTGKDKYDDKKLTYSLEQRDHTTVSDCIFLNPGNKTLEQHDHTGKPDCILLNPGNQYFEKGMPQLKHYYSIGIGVNLQTTGTNADYESGASFSLGMTWYPDGLLILNNNKHRHKTWSGITGYELSIAVIPYLEDKSGPDEVKSIYVYGLGVVFDSVDYYSLPIQIRTGLSISDTGKSALYLGINIPFYFFGT